MSATTDVSVFDRISDLLEDLDATKTAMEAEGAGGSKHPTETSAPDDGNREPQTGEHAADDDKTLKEEAVPAASVNATPEATKENAPKQEDSQPAGSNSPKAVGEAPEVEKDYGSRFHDAPTKHPANAEFGPKYSHLSEEKVAEMETDELYKIAVDIGNDLLADVANGFLSDGAQEKTAMKVMTYCRKCHKDYEGDSCPDCAAGDKSAADSGEDATEKAASAGYQDAALSGEALENAVAAEIVDLAVKRAEDQAELVATYLSTLKDSLEKAAMHAEDPDAAAAADAGADTSAGDIPPELLAAVGHDSAPAEDSSGADADALAAEPDAAAGEEHLPENLDDVSDDEALQELNMALMEQGIDPAELAAAAAGAEHDPAAAEALQKTASAAVDFKRSGKFVIREAKTARERRVRDLMKGYISELIQRSQR